MVNAVQTSFAYSDLAPDTRAIVEAATDRLHVLERKTGEQIIEIGKILIQVKVDIPHGRFLPWLEAEFGWSQQSASNFIRVAEHFGKLPNFSNFAPSALYALASNTVPAAIRKEFVAKAEAGEKVTHKDVKARIATKDIDAVRQSMYKPVNPLSVDSDPEDDEPLSDFPYERIDPYTGEVLPNDAPAPRTASAKPAPQRRPEEPYEDKDARAHAVAADLCARHGTEQAIRIADAIYRQTGHSHG